MTLDEMEKLAKDRVGRGAFECGETEVALAKALLAVLPVVRVAMNAENEPDLTRLLDAIDALHEEMRKG